MKELHSEIMDLLKALEERKALDYLVLVGSWAALFYKEYFKKEDYHSVIRTTDIDFLIPKKPTPETKIDISKLMAEKGFLEEFSQDGWVTYHKPEFHVEFLWPRLGPRPADVLNISELGVAARPLRHMKLLTENVIQVPYGGIDLNLPHPATYALHKLIISKKRKQQEKALKDREQAKTVVLALAPSDRTLLK